MKLAGRGARLPRGGGKEGGRSRRGRRGGGQGPGDPPRALTLQPLLLELRRDVADVRPLQRLARHLERGLRAVEVGQLLRQVHDVRALQPPPRDAAPVQRRVAQLVAEALQLLLAQVLQRRQEQLAGGGRAGLLAAGGGQAGGSACGPRPETPAPPPGVGVPSMSRGSDAPHPLRWLQARALPAGEASQAPKALPAGEVGPSGALGCLPAPPPVPFPHLARPGHTPQMKCLGRLCPLFLACPLGSWSRTGCGWSHRLAQTAFRIPTAPCPPPAPRALHSVSL